MTISASGVVSAADIRTEYGLSGTVSFADLYRGGSYVRAKAANNNATNLASSVPTSGVITLDDFRGTAKGFRYTYSAGATDQNASSLFGSDYSINYPKEIVINSGVELGATSTSEEALEIDSGGAGTITITNNGTLSGAGGAAGADGGDAFEAAVSCTFINNGTVRAGGGGGGTGGAGSYNSDTHYTLWQGLRWIQSSSCCYLDVGLSYSNNIYVGNNSTYYNNGIIPSGSGAYHRGSYCCSAPYGRVGYHFFFRQVVNTTGGAGGVGAGYSQSAGTGGTGGTNSGNGGDGGAFGASGTSGTNGTSSNGAAGGAAGKYLRGSSFITFTNNGTALGGTA